MNQLRINNDSIKSFAISTIGRNLKSFGHENCTLAVSYSFDMTNPEFILLPNTSLNPLSRGDFSTLIFIHECPLLRAGKELCS